MRTFGKSREVQFFMTEKDEEEFFKEVIKDKKVNFADLRFTIDGFDKDSKVSNKPPKNIKFFSIFIESSNGEKEGINIHRSINRDNVLISGRISAFVSIFKFDEKGNKIEISKSKEFIKLWDEISNLIKKSYTKIYPIGMLINYRKNYPANYAGPDAITLYKRGLILTDGLITSFHPLGISKEKAEKHDEKFLKEVKKKQRELPKGIGFVDGSRRRHSFSKNKWEEVK